VAASASYLLCVNNITTIPAISSHAPFYWLSIVTLFTISKLAARAVPEIGFTGP